MTPYPTYQELTDRLQRATTELSALLAHLDREGSCEYQHVSALEDELTAILAVLQGGDDQ